MHRAVVSGVEVVGLEVGLEQDQRPPTATVTKI